MCRLFGYTTKDPKGEAGTLVKALGEFRMLAEKGCVPCGIEKGHYDGWGIVAYKGGAPALYYRSTKAITNDSNFTSIQNQITDIRPDMVMCHLRKTSRGENSVLNTQPFLSDTTSLCHNGTIYMPMKMTPGGISDSLAFFRTITNEPLKTAGKSFEKIYKKMSTQYSYSSMNMLFSDGKQLYAIRNWNKKHKEAEKLCFEEYYTLYSFKNTKTTFICSEPLPALQKYQQEECTNIKLYKI